MGYLRGLADLPKNPPVTTTILVVCIGLFLLINSDPQNWRQILSLAGYRDAGQIWDGQWWALITTAFVHIELWHLAFNLYWLWVLGGRLELRAVDPGQRQAAPSGQVVGELAVDGGVARHRQVRRGRHREPRARPEGHQHEPEHGQGEAVPATARELPADHGRARYRRILGF